MKKELLLTLAVTTLTVTLTLTGIRYYAPQLLGIPADLQLVQVAEEVPPFYDNVFRDEDHSSQDFFINDPTLRRQMPLYPETEINGPHDILGFRNRAVPNRPDIITIGDSQTYGSNASLAQNWPSRLGAELGDEAKVYNMGVHGWGPAEYLEIFRKALYFSPRAIVFAFYTGNDPADTFIRVYGDDRWRDYRADPNLDESDYPEVEWPVPREQIEFAPLPGSGRIGFTPTLRLVSNLDDPAVDAAWVIMEKLAEEIGRVATANNLPVVFTIIPTKELVFSKRLVAEGSQMSPTYYALVDQEKKRIETFAKKLLQISGSLYVDLLTPLSEAVFETPEIYPSSPDGHPLPAGYELIAKTLAPSIKLLMRRE